MNGYVCLSPPVIFQVKIKPHTTTANKSSLRAPHTRSRVEKWNPLPRVVCTYRDHVTPHLIKYTLIINLSQKIFFIFMLCQRLFCSPAFKTHAELIFIFFKIFQNFSMFFSNRTCVLIRMNFKCRDRHLNIIHFQKVKVLRNQVAKFYQTRVVPDRVWKKGAP